MSSSSVDAKSPPDVKAPEPAVAGPLQLNDEKHASDDGAGGLQALWIRFMTFLHWYPKDMSYQEKSLTLKLDLSILVFGCLSFFTKYLDQQSITNAYVR